VDAGSFFGETGDFEQKHENKKRDFEQNRQNKIGDFEQIREKAL